MLSFNISSGQNYDFDILTNSTFSTQNFPNQERTHLFNSSDFSYYMRFYSLNDSLKSRLYDTKNKQIHTFFVDSTDSMKLKYLKTLNIVKNDIKYYFDFSEIKTKKNHKEIIFKILNEKKRKIGNYKFKIKESKKNFFQIFKHSATELFLLKKIEAPYNFTVLKAKGRNTHGNMIKYELKSLEKISLSVSLPSK
ncbi:MAG: hypothetical protein BM549_01745 [Lacinutrix sp. MedPE-SW]|nr:MAG: hypothetical protein BM549_01745 [Lacinutrix sp. MedPE-SW]